MTESITKSVQNERLHVEIALPGKKYHYSRFDWTGFIVQITLDNKHTFCTPESFIQGHGTLGEGLCNEFGILEPIGYDEAEQGSYFPKIGIGLIEKRDTGVYEFPKFYNVKPFEVDMHWENSSVTFHSKPEPVNGYAVSLKKTLQLEDNTLSILYTLENCGEKPIHTTEYCHNFVAMNHTDMGPDYVLTLPVEGHMQSQSDVMEINPPTINLKYTPDYDFYAITQAPWKGVGKGWELTHLASGVSMSETVDFEPVRLAVWGSKHVISPEIFIEIKLNPGETMSWSRRYVFSV